jgi:hypothetical protein
VQKPTELSSTSLSLTKHSSSVTTENGKWHVLSVNEQRLGEAHLSLLSSRRQVPKNIPPLTYKNGNFMVILPTFYEQACKTILKSLNE